MKCRLPLALAIVALTMAAWWLRHDPTNLQSSKREAALNRATPASSSPQTDAPAPKSQAEQARAGSPLAAKLNAPEGSAAQDVEIVRQLIHQYLTALQRNAGPPIGDDRDLVRVLTGRNPLHLTVIPATNPAISPQGRLLDRFGTPFLIHPLSSRSFQVRSAGPDRKLFTPDDVVIPADNPPP